MIVRWETPLPIDIYDFFSILRVPSNGWSKPVVQQGLDNGIRNTCRQTPSPLTETGISAAS